MVVVFLSTKYHFWSTMSILASPHVVLHALQSCMYMSCHSFYLFFEVPYKQCLALNILSVVCHHKYRLMNFSFSFFSNLKMFWLMHVHWYNPFKLVPKIGPIPKGKKCQMYFPNFILKIFQLHFPKQFKI